MHMIDTIFLHLLTWRLWREKLRKRVGGTKKQHVVVMPPAFAVPPTPALTLPLPAPSVAIVFLPHSIPLTPAPIALAWALVVSRAFPVFTPAPCVLSMPPAFTISTTLHTVDHACACTHERNKKGNLLSISFCCSVFNICFSA